MALTEKEKRALFGSYQTAIDQRNAGYSPNQTTLTPGAESYNELIRQEEAARKAAYDNRISNAQKFNNLAARYTSLVDRLNNAASRYGADYGKQKSNYQSINRSRNEFSGVSDEIEDMLAEIDASDLDDATKNEFATALIELGKATDSASLDARSRSAAYTNPATQRIMQQEDAAAFAWSKYDDYERMLQSMPNRLATQALTTAPYDYQGLAPSVANAKMEAMPEGNAKEAVRTWLDSPTGKLITDSALGAEIERLKGISVDTAISSVQQTISDLDEKANEMKRYWDEQAYLNDNSGSAPDYAEYERLLEEQKQYEEILRELYNAKEAEEMSGYAWSDDSIVRSHLSENYNATNLYDRVNKAYFDTTVDFGVEYTPNRGVKTSSYPIAQRPENYMTQEERDTFNKLWHYESEEAATAYFERLTPTLEARGAQQVMAEAKQFTEDYPNWAWAQARGANAMKPITSAFMIGDILSGNGINENSAANLNTSVANFVDSYVPQVTNYTGDAQILGRDLDQFLYGTAGSVIDSGVRTLTASFLGGGGSGATLRENIKSLSRATGALMSLEVFPTVVLQEKEKGRSDTEAVVLGTLRAAIEGLTEKYSIEMLFSPSRNFGTQLLKGAVAEGSEEIAATVLNGAVDIIAGDKDNIIAEFERRVAIGINPSEALADILLERGKSTLVDGLSGALSGLLFTAGGGAAGAFETSSEAKNASKTIEGAQILVEQALAENPNSKVALNAQKQLAAGKNISAKTVQQLINENESIYRQDDQQKVTEAVIKELTNRGEATAVRETAEAIAKAVSGENLSDGELRSIEGSVFGTQIYNEITGKAEGGEWMNQLREDLDILKIAPQTKKQESRAKRVTVRNADATTKSGESVQILGLQAQDDGTVSVKVRGTNGAESVVAASELNMSEESQDLVEGVAKFKGAAPAVYAAYMPTNDISAYLNDAEFVVEAARGVVAENDGSAMLQYLKNSRHISELADIQIETIFNAALADGRKTLAAAQPLSTAGSGQFTYAAKRAESSLRGREAASTVFMQNLAKVAPNIDIEVFESIARNGKYIGEQGSYSNGKIRIDLNAGKNFTYEVAESAMLRTLSHELTHHLQRTAPKQYADLKAFVIKHLAEWNGGKELDDLISAKQRRSRDGLSYAAAMDEVVADSCEMMLKNSKAIQQLAAENKGLFAKIRDFVKKFLSDLRRAFAGVEATDAAAKYLQKFESEMQQLWDAAFTASVENSRMTSTAIPAANTLMNPMQETQFSLREDEKFMQNAINANKAKQLVPYRVMAAAQDARSAIAAIMRDPKLQDALNLPADLMGKTYFPDGAYNGTEENTLVCPRSMGAEELLDAVSEMIGRPLTVDECIEVSQFIAGSEFKPECEYCYVATDRKAYRAFLKSYVEQRDSVIEKYKGGMSKAALYEEFLDGRKDTKNMRDRFNLWIKIVDQNLPMMQASDLANVNKLMHDIIEPGIRDQVKDAMKYAQSASWAKKRVGYTAYNGHILKWSQTKINQLNKGFGLRMYSFSDFSPAFILENMQMITDAAVRGLKMMAYTKEADFVKIFAPTGININVSTFGFERNGVVAENAMQGVSWKEAQELRAKYPNVGITFVATNDNLVNWALEQDWIDVVIPYHLVRTGKQVAERLGFMNYTSESGDIKASDWTKGRDLSSITPTMHNNDKQTYLDALEANHLQPRFKRWIDHPNYMKLVNETRLSSLESKPVQPKFDLESAKKSLIGMIKDGGYFQHIGGSVDRMYEIASGIAENFDDGTQFSDRDYSYSALVGKPDMIVTGVSEIKNPDRTDTVNKALKNAASIGYTNARGNAVVHVDDINADVIVSKRSLVHGLDRRLNAQAPVLTKIGSVLKNSIRVNELVPRDQNASNTYVLIGAAKSENGIYIASFVVNHFSNEIAEIDVLYSANAKKESAAFLPKITDKSATPTDSTISIANLFDYVNRYFPDILPESVLRHYGHVERPAGTIGANALFSDRDYAAAVRSDNVEKMSQMVDAAANAALAESQARANGKLVHLYHGTEAFGFTEFDPSRSVENTMFFSDNIRVSAEYNNGKAVPQRIGKPFVAKKSYSTQDLNAIADRYREYKGIQIKELTVDAKAGNRAVHLVTHAGIDQYYSAAEFDKLVWSIDKAYERGSGIYEVVLDMKNPLIVDAKYNNWDSIPFEGRVRNTRQISRSARLRGYDGVIFKNLHDVAGTNEVNPAYFSTVYAVFKPNQVFSADPVTYDNNGNVIPLSERFNPENNDIRYSDRDYEAAEIADLENEIAVLERRLGESMRANSGMTESVKSRIQTIERSTKLTQTALQKRTQELERIQKRYENENRASERYRLDEVISSKQKEIDRLSRKLESNASQLRDLQSTASMSRDEISAQLLETRKKLEERQAAYAKNLSNYRERRNESESKSYYRERVFKRIRDMQDMLITNSDKKHIPEILKEPLGNFLMSLDTSSATKLKGKGETKRDVEMIQRTAQLKDALNKARNATGVGGYLDISDEFIDKQFEEMVTAINSIYAGMDVAGTDPISLMSAAQLKNLNFVLRTLQKSISDMNKLMATARFQTVAEAAESTITELDQIPEYQMKGKGAEALRGTINWKNTTPVYAFDRMGEAGKELFRAMWEAQGEFAFHTKEILETREGFVSDKQVRKWSQDVQTIQLSDNRSIRMTTAQMMAFYCLTKRQQALDHLKTGGIRISNIEYGRNHIQQARAYHLSADDIVKIANMVKGDAKRVADQLQQYMTERGSEWGNQISMARFGYRAFTEPVYFPIRTESSQIAKDTKSTQENSINRLLNMSFTKSTQPNASTSVVVDNIFDVFSAHMSDMAKYNAFALPVLDMIKWFDYNVQERLEDGVQKDHRAVKTSIESAYGKDALNYISTFLEDVNGANEGGRVRSASLSQKFISHYKASAVGANLRVAIQQPTSYWRAAAVLSPKYLAVGEKVMWHNAKKYYKEMSKYAGIATWKELGFRDFNVGRSVREQIAGTLSASAQAYDKVMDASMKLAALGDTWTWCRLWEACKAEVKATQKLSGEELMHATAERFNEVIARTQVVDSVMTRSHTMRSKNLLDQLMTPFMAEPTLSYNVMASSVFDYRTEIRKSNKQDAWKKHGKKMIRAFGVFAVTAFWTGVFQSLADALRDDDDYEEFYKKFLDAMLPRGLPKGKFNEDPIKWIEEALDQGNFLANMNIASNIPGLHRELLNVLKGFGSEAMWTAGISNLYNAVAAVYEKIALEAGWMEEATDVTWNGNMTWWGAIQKSLQSASQISSLPIYNLLRDATALYNTTVQEFFGRQDIKLLSYDPGTEGRVANAYADGFLTFDEAMGEMLKFGVSQDKAYETLMKSAGFGKYDELREAIVNGGDVNAVMEKLTGYGIKEDLITNNVKAIIKDLVLGTEDEPPMIDKKTAKNLLIQYLGMTVPEAHYTVEAYGEENFSKYDDLRDAILNGGDVQAAMDELTEYGTKESDVLSEIRASIKVWYQGETKDDGTVVDPVIDKDRAVELLVQYGDRDEDEATELVTEWSLTVDTGVKDIKESFIAGDLTTDEAIDYRMTYYGQSEEDAAQTVAEWIFEDEYGYAYSEIGNEYKDGNISADEVINVLIEYGGKTEKEAKSSLAGHTKDAYKEGILSWSEAESILTSKCGMTSEATQAFRESAEFEETHGYTYDNTGDQYKNGEISQSEAKSALTGFGGKTESEANETIAIWDYQKSNPNTALSSDQIKQYLRPIEGLGYSAKDAGISDDAFYTYKTNIKGLTGYDADGDGKTDSGSKKNQILPVIDSLPISNEQKDALYYLNGWAASKIWEAPWR